MRLATHLRILLLVLACSIPLAAQTRVVVAGGAASAPGGGDASELVGTKTQVTPAAVDVASFELAANGTSTAGLIDVVVTIANATNSAAYIWRGNYVATRQDNSLDVTFGAVTDATDTASISADTMFAFVTVTAVSDEPTKTVTIRITPSATSGTPTSVTIDYVIRDLTGKELTEL